MFSVAEHGELISGVNVAQNETQHEKITPTEDNQKHRAHFDSQKCLCLISNFFGLFGSQFLYTVYI